MTRRVFNLLAAVSLLLCVAASGLWLRSYFTADVLEWTYEDVDARAIEDLGGRQSAKRVWRERRFELYNGSAAVHTTITTRWREFERFGSGLRPLDEQPLPKEDDDPAPPVIRYWRGPAATHAPGGQGPIEIHIVGGSGSQSLPSPSYSVPLWPAALVASVLPARWMWHRHRRRQREQRGMCSRCGYDLRASPERCPECGTTATTEGRVGGQHS